MTLPDSNDVAHQAELIYEQKLRGQLEQTHLDDFVAIEPQSGDYFLGRTLSEALGAARKTYPKRLSHVLRIGHRAAIHLGAVTR